MNNEIKLLPKINIELKELRKRAKLLGYKVQTQTVGFDGDYREVWHLVSLGNGEHIDGVTCLDREKYNRHITGFNFMREVCKHI